MEEKLLKLLKLADLLNEKQNEVYAQIIYTANHSNQLEITIRSKKDFSYVQRFEIQLVKNPIIRMDDVIKLFESYIGGANNE